jgi:NAD(P)H dehydrogenase (quinone)
MVKCLILVGHPIDGSFNRALAERYAARLEAGGAEIRLLHLSELDIPPSLSTRHPGDAELVGDVARVWDSLLWADHFVLFHPLWWGGMPARLKALIDVVLQAGKAYRYVPGRPLPLGLLKGRTARLVVTSDTPGWFMALAYGNAPFRQARNQIFKFVGFEQMRLTHCAVIRDSTPEQRAAMLDRMDRAAGQDLGWPRRVERRPVADRAHALMQ